jgi:hypothetical protein
MRREVAIVRTLDHPNIVHILDFLQRSTSIQDH